MGSIRPIRNKTKGEIAEEWDIMVKYRIEQMEKGKDLSLTYVNVPCIVELASQCDFSSVIDLGCGAGFLTKELSKKAHSIIGVDMSKESINIAKKSYSGIRNLEFVNSTIEDYSVNAERPIFTLATANMVLMDAIGLDKLIKSIARILVPNAHFIFTITHPCFWPFYWRYVNESWFDYRKEILIEADFKISLDTTSGIVTTHIHRPLEQYITSLIKAGFIIETIMEPMPSEDIQAMYPEIWKYPRFLGVRCVLIK